MIARPAFIAELLEAAEKVGEGTYFAAETDNIIALARYIDELEAARDAARNEALEEAAKKCDEIADPAEGMVCINLSPSGHCQRSGHQDCLCQDRQEAVEALAAAIRALKSKENEHE